MSAMGAAISGLQSSEQWLSVISNNVSNSETVGYKAQVLNFADLISQDLSSASPDNSGDNVGGIDAQQIGLGVTVGSIATDIAQGSIETTGNVTDIAIQGQGYLTVKNGNSTDYTRAGNLTFDSTGNLVTAEGGLVQGWSLSESINPNVPPAAVGVQPPAMTLISTTLNTADTAAIGNITIPNNLELGPQATSDNLVTADQALGVSLAGNLDSATPNTSATLLAAAVPPITSAAPPTTQAAVSLLTQNANATSNFTVYDSLGTAHNFTVYWVQTANVPTVPAVWSYYVYNTDNNTPANATAVWPTPGAFILSGGGTFAAPLAAQGTGVATTWEAGVGFNNDGSLANNGNNVVQSQNPTISLPMTNGALGSNAAAPFTFSIDLGTPNNPTAVPATWGQSNGLTGDYGSGTVNPTTGVYTPKQSIYTKSVDGFSEGTLTGLSFNASGGIEATFNNGQTLVIAQLALTNFTNPGGLENAGGNYFTPSANSGSEQIGIAGNNGLGTIQGGALEQSNVDLTVELTNMIVAQKMFESNSKSITTQANVLETLIQAVPAQ